MRQRRLTMLLLQFLAELTIPTWLLGAATPAVAMPAAAAGAQAWTDWLSGPEGVGVLCAMASIGWSLLGMTRDRTASDGPTPLESEPEAVHPVW